MTKPHDREVPLPILFVPSAWPALMTLEQAQDAARATMRCSTCKWAVRPGDECAEQEFVLGCIHWKSR